MLFRTPDISFIINLGLMNHLTKKVYFLVEHDSSLHGLHQADFQKKKNRSKSVGLTKKFNSISYKICFSNVTYNYPDRSCEVLSC